MLISINNPVGQTWIFTILLCVALILSIRRDKNRNFFPISTTEELKGLAILAVVFSHIGYFLVSDHRFLFPLSTISGVAVDLFLFLSGFGLTISTLKKGGSAVNFYLKRLPRLFIPFWIVLVSFLLLDFFILKISYPWQTVLKGFFGIFTRADIYQDINSPFWYFTLILFYYLIYPLVFLKKMPWVSALIIYIVSYLIVFQWNPTFIFQVSSFYLFHILAFPLGMLFAWGYKERERVNAWFIKIWKQYKRKNQKIFGLIGKIFKITSVKRFEKNMLTSLRYLVMVGLVFLIGYTTAHSGAENQSIVALISNITVLAIFILFVLKKFDFKLLSFVGLYSYEIYLLHWPIMYRYDIFYRYFPAGIATALYLVLFLFLAWVIHKIVERIIGKRKIKI
jgi:peptidoglycan/LPS O-acetylase OafA/YrhL